MKKIVRKVVFLPTVAAMAACTSPTTVFSEEAFNLGQTHISADSVQAGQSVEVSTEVASSMDANGVIVHLQIFDAHNNSVAQQSWEGQTFDKGETLTYHMDWVVPVYQQSGDYVASVGIFDADWSQIEWFDSQASLAVKNSGEEAFTLSRTGFSADSAKAGQSVEVSTEIATSLDVDDLIVNLQVFDSSNQSIINQSWEGQDFQKGETLAYSLDWSIPTHQYAGDYVVSVGIFDENWSQIRWFDSQAAMSIAKAAGPAKQALPIADLKLDNAPLDRLPGHFGLGVKADRQGDFDWMAETGAPFDYSYGYLAGGVNTGEGWADWSSPAGSYALRFMESSDERGYIPVFSYYQIVQSYPNSGEEPPYNNLLDPGTMAAYFDDWILLMKAAADFGKPVIVHQEPDLWGYLQQRSDDPTESHVTVDASGHPDVAGIEDNGRGLAQALVKLRNDYAPNVLLAWHANPWAARADLTLQNDDGVATGKRVGDFFLSLQAPFDLIFYGISDRDAAWREARKSQDAIWDEADYVRFFDYIRTIQTKTGLKAMIWQIPLGNTIYRTVNNTPGHFQDNHVEYYLLPDNRQHLVDHAAIGIIGLLFGGGAAEQTRYTDAAGDGITNPEAINGNDRTAEYPDDDGGLLRLTSKAFYDLGLLPVR